MTTDVRLPPLRTIDDAEEHLDRSGDSLDRGGRKVVWSAGSGAGAMRTRGRRRRFQQVSFVVAAVAAVATMAGGVSTWSIIGPVGDDPATALWIAPAEEAVSAKNLTLASVLSLGTSTPDSTRSAIPTNSSWSPPNVERATWAGGALTGTSADDGPLADIRSNGLAGAVTPSGQQTSQASPEPGEEQTTPVVDPGEDVVDSGLDEPNDRSGQGSSRSNAGSAKAGKGKASARGSSGSDAEPGPAGEVGEGPGTDPETDPASKVGQDKGSDRGSSGSDPEADPVGKTGRSPGPD